MTPGLSVTDDHVAELQEHVGDDGKVLIESLVSATLSAIEEFPGDDEAKAALAVLTGLQLIDGATD